ncbi:MAG: polyribonucleotide nucleotidyltransferase [Candidatus Wildermuthbacteria bacterium]|nr:polyribonucleotide nucleotidyltransferase [Candidatus Wildermuthbacteria bacterium]
MANHWEIKLGEREISFEATDLAEQANGAFLMRTGDTVILVTSVISKNQGMNMGFFPLSVEYEERFYAAGKILGSRFVRREGRPADEAILTARVIDRAIRPLFNQKLAREVQVIATCLSWDGENDPDVLGLLGASASLSVSDIPWAGPIAGVRVGRVEGSFILNPTYEQRAKGDMDIVFAGVKEKDEFLVNMIEGSGKEISEEDFEKALQFARPFLLQLIEFQEKIQKQIGKEKTVIEEPAPDPELEKEVKNLMADKLEKALFQGDKKTRMASVDALKKEVLDALQETYKDDAKTKFAKGFFDSETDRIVHEAAIIKGKRVDDRKLDETRELSGSVALLPRTHGSGLFARGQTKTLSLLTLGAPGDSKILEGMEFIGKKRFLHHYNFPPYAPGETKPMRGPGRREIGHGMLVEKALLPVIPSIEKFPYTIRIVTEVVSSNGSTSMASVCSSSLALMDAGVPIASPVAGISVGLMSDQTGWKLLSDIQGPEDHHGDMDFKVAGTKKGITAIQLDVKVRGITEEIAKGALERAKNVRIKILDEVIANILPAPRPQLSPLAPKIFVLKINPEKIGLVIGSGGKTINKIIEDYGVEIDIDDTGEVFITGQDETKAKQASDLISNMVREVQIGDFFEGKVVKTTDFGAFVQLFPGQDGLVHISQLSDKRVGKVTDIVKTGDIIPVKVIGVDDQGKISLSFKDAKKQQEKNGGAKTN